MTSSKLPPLATFGWLFCFWTSCPGGAVHGTGIARRLGTANSLSPPTEKARKTTYL